MSTTRYPATGFPREMSKTHFDTHRAKESRSWSDIGVHYTQVLPQLTTIHAITSKDGISIHYFPLAGRGVGRWVITAVATSSAVYRHRPSIPEIRLKRKVERSLMLQKTSRSFLLAAYTMDHRCSLLLEITPPPCQQIAENRRHSPALSLVYSLASE